MLPDICRPGTSVPSSRNVILHTKRAAPMAATTSFFARSSSIVTPRLPSFRPFSTGRHPLLQVRPLSTKPFSPSASSAPVEICVKESLTVPGKLGDCPFTQRVLLTFEEKHLPYDMKLVDFANKPEWFLKISPEGKVPVAKLDENWVADSDIITQTIEEKFPDPPLATPPQKSSVGAKIFSCFVAFLKSKDPNDGTEQALLSELTVFNDYLKENSVFSRESFVKTKALREDVIAGWRPKVLA